MSKRNQLLIRFLFNTGARVSEVAGLRNRDVEQKEPKGHFDASYTKRGKTRPYFLDSELHKDLVDHIGPKGYLDSFLDHKVFRLGIRGVQKIIEKLVNSSDVNKNISAHSFRRSFATFHRRHNTPIDHIADLMGHSSTETTRRYILNDEGDLGKYKTIEDFIREKEEQQEEIKISEGKKSPLRQKLNLLNIKVDKLVSMQVEDKNEIKRIRRENVTLRQQLNKYEFIVKKSKVKEDEQVKTLIHFREDDS